MDTGPVDRFARDLGYAFGDWMIEHPWSLVVWFVLGAAAAWWVLRRALSEYRARQSSPRR